MKGIGWLPAAARKAGLDVYVMPGFETRSTWASGLASILGVVWHHTATSLRWLDGHVALLLRDGRRDLSGPLSQIGVERDGTAVFVAAGRANHNGYGEWGNDSVGIEFYSDGVTEHLTPQQIHTGVVLTALILRHEGLPADRTKAHKETDPKRKIDPLTPPAMANVRADVAAALHAVEPTHPKDTMRQIAFYQAPGGHNHAYLVSSETGVGKYLTEAGLALSMYLNLPTANTPDTAFDDTWRSTVLLFDGPLRNVP